MKVCITGGAGFIGSHVAEAFLLRGDTVVVVDNLSTGSVANVPTGARFIHCDITTDEFDAVMDAESFDVVSHHAAHIELRISIEKPVVDATANVLGTVRLLEACRRSGVSHVIIASSGGGLYGEQEHLAATEESPLRPSSPYGVSKIAAEQYAEYYTEHRGLPITILRYSNVYGPRQNPHGDAGVIAIFLEAWKLGKTPFVYGDGSQTRDYLFVHDAAQANVVAVENKLVGTYNVSTGMETTLNEMIAKMQAALHSKQWLSAPIQYVGARMGDMQRSVCSYTKLHNATGWKPEIGVEFGIRNTVEWFVGIM